MPARGPERPPQADARTAAFRELLANAISDTDVGAEVKRLAEEQASLRRVATLVAHQASQADIFTAIAEELGQVLGVQDIRMIRYLPAADGDGGTAVVVASWGSLSDVLEIGERHPLGGANVTTLVFRTGQAARVDDYATANGPIAERVARGGIRAAVGTPIVVEGRLWGAIVAAAAGDDPLPPGTEARLDQFTELMGTAVANTEARGEIARLAEEQAALRRVATLVAEGAAAEELLAKVAEEVANLLGRRVDSAILRYEPDETATVVAVWGEPPRTGSA